MVVVNIAAQRPNARVVARQENLLHSHAASRVPKLTSVDEVELWAGTRELAEDGGRCAGSHLVVGDLFSLPFRARAAHRHGEVVLRRGKRRYE